MREVKREMDLRGVTAVHHVGERLTALWKAVYGSACDDARESSYYHKREPTDLDVERAARRAYDIRVVGILSRVYDDTMIETLAAKVHDAWMDECRRNGLTTRISSLTGEEQMVPYDQLSDPVQEYDRATARTVLTALRGILDETWGEDAPPTGREGEE